MNKFDNEIDFNEACGLVKKVIDQEESDHPIEIKEVKETKKYWVFSFEGVKHEFLFGNSPLALHKKSRNISYPSWVELVFCDQGKLTIGEKINLWYVDWRG